MFPDLASDNPPHKVSPTADTRQLHGTSHTRDPREMRPQAARRLCALLQPQSDRRRTPPFISHSGACQRSRGNQPQGKTGQREAPGGWGDCTIHALPHINQETAPLSKDCQTHRIHAANLSTRRAPISTARLPTLGNYRKPM